LRVVDDAKVLDNSNGTYTSERVSNAHLELRNMGAASADLTAVAVGGGMTRIFTNQVCRDMSLGSFPQSVSVMTDGTRVINVHYPPFPTLLRLAGYTASDIYKLPAYLPKTFPQVGQYVFLDKGAHSLVQSYEGGRQLSRRDEIVHPVIGQVNDTHENENDRNLYLQAISGH
jgi:hypothetical protein